MSISTSTLEACVRTHVGDAGPDLTFAPIPTGKFNRSYFVADGKSEWVLRIAPDPEEIFLFYERGMMRQERGLHRLLRERTDVPVPRVVAYDETCEVIARTFILMERLPGNPLSETTSADQGAVLRQVGQALAQVHAITGDRYGYVGEHAPMPPSASWAEAFRTMWHLLLQDIAGVGSYTAEACRQLERLLDDHLAVFDRPVKAHLLHMDLWAQNILVDGANRLTGLIDWDRALWGDPEIEYAVLDYCGISEPSFWEGYGTARDLSADARLRQVFYLLYELQKYIAIRRGQRNDPQGAEQYRQQAAHILHHAFGLDVAT